MPTVDYKDNPLTFPPEALGERDRQPHLRAADELLLTAAAAAMTVGVLHDAHGVIATCLAKSGTQISFVSDRIQHHDRWARSRVQNELKGAGGEATSVLAPADRQPSVNLMTLPKNHGLLRLYLDHIAHAATADTELAIVFRTKDFSPALLDIAGEYAADVSQSRAYKKYRLLHLRGWQRKPFAPILTEYAFAGINYRQYPGVFSRDHVDNATRFLLEGWGRWPELRDLPEPTTLLDVGCGNGIIADVLGRVYADAQLHLTDVSAAALASARINLGERKHTLHWTADLEQLSLRPDLIVTNPPFHEGRHNTVDIALNLFAAAARLLAPGGHLVVVANRHLGYLPTLERHFVTVTTVAEDRKYRVYVARKGD